MSLMSSTGASADLETRLERIERDKFHLGAGEFAIRRNNVINCLSSDATLAYTNVMLRQAEHDKTS
jgi:hypothetical protein